MNYLKKIFQSSESGVTLILVLMLIAAVGLLVIPVVYVTATGLRATNTSEQRFNERYAADAGVEHALWKIRYESGFNPSIAWSSDPDPIFNELKTNISIEPAPTPTPMFPRPLSTPTNGGEMEASKIVTPNYTTPCWVAPCLPQLFTYTIFIDNVAKSKVHLVRFGDCLPPGFVLIDILGVGGIYDNSTGRQLTRHDFLPQDPLNPLNSYLTPEVEVIPPQPVGEPDDGNQKPMVNLSVIKNDADPTTPCLSSDPATVDRWQVKWDFGSSAGPYVPKQTSSGGGRSFLQLSVRADGLARGLHLNVWCEIETCYQSSKVANSKG